MPPRSNYLVPVVLGAATGVIVGLLVWRFAARSLAKSLDTGESQLAAQLSTGVSTVRTQAVAGRAAVEVALAQAIQRQVLPAVKAQVTHSLRTSGVTPQLIADVKQAVALARRAGVLV